MHACDYRLHYDGKIGKAKQQYSFAAINVYYAKGNIHDI